MVGLDGRDVVACLSKLDGRRTCRTLLEPLLGSCLPELHIVFVLLASVVIDFIQKRLAGRACELTASIVHANSVADTGERVSHVHGRAEKRRAGRIRAVDAVPATVSIREELITESLLGQHRVFALLFHLECPPHVKRNVVFVEVEEKDLAAALGRIQALILGRALEEATDIVGADPVLLARSLYEQAIIFFLVAAADDASLCHGGLRAQSM